MVVCFVLFFDLEFGIGSFFFLFFLFCFLFVFVFVFLRRVPWVFGF